jgi:hypothetical protein
MSRIDSLSCVPVNNPAVLNSQIARSSTSIDAAEVKVSQSQTSDLAILTAEGDTFTWSSSKSAELSFSTYNAQGDLADASAVSAASMELRRTSAFSITLDGELNKDELKDIRSAIRTMQKAANDIRKGHEEKAATRMAKLADLDQLAGIDADLGFTREVSFIQLSAQSEMAAGTESIQTPEPVPAPTLDSQQTEPSQTGVSAPVSGPVESSSTAAATVATATASTHLSVWIQTLQTPAEAAPANTPDPSMSALWWFPSQDLWNILYPKKDSLAATETPVTA